MEILFSAISIILNSLRDLSVASSDSRSKKKREVGKILSSWVVKIDQMISGANSLIGSLEKIFLLIAEKRDKTQYETQLDEFKKILHTQYNRIIGFSNDIYFQRVGLREKFISQKNKDNVENAFKILNVYSDKRGYLKEVSTAKILALLGIHYFLDKLSHSDIPKTMPVLFYKPCMPFPTVDAFEIIPDYFSIPLELSDEEADKVAANYHEKFISEMEDRISRGWFEKIEINITNKKDRSLFIETLKQQVKLLEEVSGEIKVILKTKFEVDEII